MTGKPTITRPKLVEAFNEIRGYGMEMDKLIDLHEHIVPLIDPNQRNAWCAAGAEHVADRIKPREALPADTEIARVDHYAGESTLRARLLTLAGPLIVGEEKHPVPCEAARTN